MARYFWVWVGRLATLPLADQWKGSRGLPKYCVIASRNRRYPRPSSFVCNLELKFRARRKYARYGHRRGFATQFEVCIYLFVYYGWNLILSIPTYLRS
jgi:hypothetical protein